MPLLFQRRLRSEDRPVTAQASRELLGEHVSIVELAENVLEALQVLDQRRRLLRDVRLAQRLEQIAQSLGEDPRFVRRFAVGGRVHLAEPLPERASSVANQLACLGGKCTLGPLVVEVGNVAGELFAKTRLDLREATLPTGSGAYTLLSAAQGGLAGANFQFGTMYGAMPLGQTFAFAATDTAVQLTLLPSTGTFQWSGANSNNWTTPFANGQSNWTRTGQSDYVFGTPGRASRAA